MAYGFYQEKPTLPHQEIPLRIFLKLEEALSFTWKLMRENPRPNFDLLTALEDSVTHELYERLYDEVFARQLVEGFNRLIFNTITRESKLRDYQGVHLDRMPDLLIGLAGREDVIPSQDWIFIECKPIDKTHTLGMHYCNKGIIRFTRGDYAWAMTSALMLGYTKNGYTLASKKLDDALNSSTTISTLDFPASCSRSTATTYSEPTYITRHNRDFCYQETGRTISPITLRHLWLRRE